MLNNTQITYIKALQKASKENRLVIFAGAGTSADAGIPLWTELIKELAKTLPEEVSHNFENDFLQLAQIYREVNDDKDYYDGIEAVLMRNAKSPNAIHDAILDLNPCHIVTTNYDPFIEDAALKNHRQYYVVAEDNELPRNHGEKLIIKMHGDLKHHNLVLAENDYFDYHRKFALLRSFIISLFTSKVILFIGFSFNDLNLKFILREIKSVQKKDMQHVYLLNDKHLSSIENSHMFSNGVNILSLTQSDLKDEYQRLDLRQISDIALSEKGKNLTDSLRLIKNFREQDGILGIASKFIGENLSEVRALGYAWNNLLPRELKSNVSRKGIRLDINGKYRKELDELFGSRKRIRRILENNKEDIYQIRRAFIDDDIFYINDIRTRSEAYLRKTKRNEIPDCVSHLYNLDEEKISDRVKKLRQRSLTYTIADLELPYILFETGHYYEAYRLYNKLAPEMWEKKRYALFFICIYNIHSVSWPAYREIIDMPGADTKSIEKQYVSVNLMSELDQLPLPQAVYQLFADVVNSKQLSQNLIEITRLLQSIETQRRGAERGTLWSTNNNIQNVVWNFVSFIDFTTSNYIILDNNETGELYYSSVVQCLFNSNLIPDGTFQSKLEKLFKETLIVILKLSNKELKTILKDVTLDRKLTVDKGFTDQINIYFNNLFMLQSQDEIIEDKMMGNIFANILCICSAIDNCPKIKHYEDLVAKYWTRFDLKRFVNEIASYLSKDPPTGEQAFKLLSLLANSYVTDFNLVALTKVLVASMVRDKVTFDDNRVMMFIEYQGCIEFAALLLQVLPDKAKHKVIEWLNENIKSLYELLSADSNCNEHLLTPETFSKFKSIPTKKKNGIEEIYFPVVLKKIYESSKYNEIRPLIDDFIQDKPHLKFVLHPLDFDDYSKIQPEWFEDLYDDELKTLMKDEAAFKIMKHQADVSRWGGFFKRRLNMILWQ